jgi:hypothetical protein
VVPDGRGLWGFAAWIAVLWAVAVLWVALAFAGGALAAPFVYVANNGSDGVSQYDASAGALSPLSPPTVTAGTAP